jgi:proteasome lid subunit RPN8/RPN11
MIRFDDSVRVKMEKHAVTDFPDECCGFLFGREDPDGLRTVSVLKEVVNAKAGDKRRRFEITPKDYVQAENFSLENDLLFLGVYHSHPNHPAIPSEHDRVAAQPYFSYVIISVMQGEIDHTRSWRLNDESIFEEEQITNTPINQFT